MLACPAGVTRTYFLFSHSFKSLFVSLKPLLGLQQRGDDITNPSILSKLFSSFFSVTVLPTHVQDAWLCRHIVEALGGSEAVLATELGPIQHPLESTSDEGMRDIAAQVGPTS
jgi:hypothetical protein